MKYVAIVELEYETDRDPLDSLRHSLSRLEFLEHYHIIAQPREVLQDAEAFQVVLDTLRTKLLEGPP